jgi:hypothetical protein
MGEDGQGLALAVMFRQAGQVLLPHRMIPEEPDRGVGEGPLAGGVAHRRPRGPIAFAGRGAGALDQPAIGDERLPPGETVAVRHLGEQHQAEELAHPWHRAQPGEGVGVRRFGGIAKGHLRVAEPAVVVLDQREIAGDALLPGWIRQALGHARSVGLVGELRAELGPVLVAVGRWDMRQQRGPLAHERPAAPEQITRRTHLGGVTLSLGEHAAAEQERNLLRVELVVCGLGPVDGPHVEGLAEDEGHPCSGPAVGQPGPR